LPRQDLDECASLEDDFGQTRDTLERISSPIQENAAKDIQLDYRAVLSFLEARKALPIFWNRPGRFSKTGWALA
jgi:hypothetical protein